jgi:hypothetical protein
MRVPLCLGSWILDYNSQLHSPERALHCPIVLVEGSPSSRSSIFPLSCKNLSIIPSSSNLHLAALAPPLMSSPALVTSMARQQRSRSLSYPPTYTYCPRRRRRSEDSLRRSQNGTLETFRAAIFKEIKDRLARFGVSTRWYLPQLVTPFPS